MNEQKAKELDVDRLADDLIYAGRIIERMLNPMLKPLSRDNARQFDNAVCTAHHARITLREYAAALRRGPEVTEDVARQAVLVFLHARWPNVANFESPQIEVDAMRAALEAVMPIASKH